MPTFTMAHCAMLCVAASNHLGAGCKAGGAGYEIHGRTSVAP